jgi:Putative peptidoglycan binding domain
MKRSIVVSGVLALVVGSSSVAWFAGRKVASPAEVAARTQAPAPSRITVAVAKTVLSSTLISRGLVRYGEPKPVVLAQSALKTTAPLLTLAPVKGAELKEGTKALEIGGRPVLVLEGALPTFRDMRPGDTGVDVQQLEDALGRLGYSPGSADGVFDGATEKAVSSWYRAVGYDPFEPTETQRAQLRTARDAASRAADAVLSARRAVDQGLAPDRGLTASENAKSASERVASAKDAAKRDIARAEVELAAREAAQRAASAGVASAERAVEKARSGDTGALDDANTAVADAQSQLVDAQAAVKEAERGVEDAKAAIPAAEQAVINAAADIVDARAGVETAKRGVEDAKRGKVTATQEISNPGVINLPTGVTLPPGVSIPGVGQTQVAPLTISSDSGVAAAEDNVRAAEARVRQAESAKTQTESALSAHKSAIETAAAGVERAKRNVERTQAGVDRAKRGVARSQDALNEQPRTVEDLTAKVDQARDQLAQTERDVELAASALKLAKTSGATTIRQAGAQASIASASAREVSRGGDLALARQQLASAEANATRANDEVAELESKTGTAVPANEVLFFPSLPLRIDDSRLNRGDPVNGAVMTVTTSRLAIDGGLDVADAKLTKVGATVEIEASDFNITLKGRITELADTPGTKGVDGDKVFIEVTPDAGPNADAAELNGASVKLTIPVKSSGTAVLAVPVAALSVASNGTSRIEVEDDPAKPTRFVTVTPGLAAEGLVAVTPLDAASLKEGDLVVVGSAGSQSIDGATPTDTSAVSADTEGVVESSDASTPETSVEVGSETTAALTSESTSA